VSRGRLLLEEEVFLGFVIRGFVVVGLVEGFVGGAEFDVDQPLKNTSKISQD